MKKILFLFFFLTLRYYAGAQDMPRVSLSVDSASFTQVVEALENQTNYSIFYKRQWVDSLSYTFSFVQKPLNTVLDVLVERTQLNHYMQGKQIFITKNVSILDNTKIAEMLKNSSREIQTNVEKGIVFAREYQTYRDEALSMENKVFEVGSREKLISGSTSTVAGYVKERESGAPVSDVLVYVEKPLIAATTDASGFYSLTLPVGKNKILYQLVGLETTQRNIVLFSDGQLNVEMEPDVLALKEVVIESEREANIENVQMGISNIDVVQTKNVPIVLGERDIMKVATSLAGIKTVGEGAAGFNVRGGKSDQNLITLDGAPIYNTSHFLGFFSVFNSGVVDDMQIYKGSIPARYGGRLSSVMDITSRKANRDSISGSGGISPITSKLTLEVPLFKGKSGIMLGGRTTYSNWVLKKVNNSEFNKNRVSFSDLIFRNDYDFNANNKLQLSGYYSVDNFTMKSDTLFSASDFHYQNLAGSLSYMHRFSSDLLGTLSFLYSGYQYELSYDDSPENSFIQDFDIAEGTVKSEFSYTRFDFHELNAGAEVKKIRSNPGTKQPLGEASIVKSLEAESEQAIESALYLSDKYYITKNLDLYAGLRYSIFTSLGPRTVYDYVKESPKNSDTRIDSTKYSKGEMIKMYKGLEPRLSARLKIDNVSSIKAAYNRTRQYVHTLTNSASLSPTDIWRISNAYLQPQIADQFSLGYFRNFHSNKIETSLEVYYKKIQNLLDFKVGSQFLLNPDVETVVLQGPGKSYGLELSIKKSGRLNGWINYTFARTFIKLDSKHAEERINEGAFYPANYDIPHAINLVANYKLTHRLSFSYNFSYKSGRPVTYPEGYYDYHGSVSVHYSDRNAYRIPHYMRMDVGVNLEAGHKLGKLAYGYWSFSIYNVLGRDNPYSVFFNVNDKEVKGYKLIVFGTPIPTITFNFKF